MAWKSRRGEGRVSFLYVYLRFYMMIHILPKLYYILSFVQCLYSLYILSTKIVILDKSPFIMWAVYNGNLIFMMNYFPRQIWPAWHEITFGWRERSLNGEHLYCPLPLYSISTVSTHHYSLLDYQSQSCLLSMSIHFFTRYYVIRWFTEWNTARSVQREPPQTLGWPSCTTKGFRDERECCNFLSQINIICFISKVLYKL